MKDLERKDDHLTKHAALCNVETRIEVTANDDGLVVVETRSDRDDDGDIVKLTPFQARLLSEALLEVAWDADVNRLKRT